MAKRKKKKGYAYEKALQLIAYERGEASLPSIPNNRALRGAITSWERKLEKGYRPRSKETKKIFTETALKTGIATPRPFLRVERVYHSKRVGANIRDVVFGFYIAEGEAKERYLDLLDFDEEDLETLYEIAEKLGKDNNVKNWNKEFKKAGLDVEVFTEVWIT